jgi:hypothetical protein
MRPFKMIKIGQIYKYPWATLEWIVSNKDDTEKMVEVTPLGNLPPSLQKPLWKTNRDRLFNNLVDEINL